MVFANIYINTYIQPHLYIYREHAVQKTQMIHVNSCQDIDYMSVFITGVWNFFPKMYGKQLSIKMWISSCLIQ